jgi:hypothetical protein
MAVDGYQRHCAELATATARRDTEVAAAEQSYVDGVHALTTTAADAETALNAATGELREAQRAAGRIDAEAAVLWGRAGEVLGWRGARRLGALPGPDLSTVDGDPRVPLRRVGSALHRYRLGLSYARLPGRFLVALPALGAVGAGLAVYAGHGFGATILGVAVAPLPGLVTAKVWAERRYRARLDIGAVGLTVLGALLAAGALTVLLH